MDSHCVENQTVNISDEDQCFSIPISSCGLLESGRKSLAIGHYESKAALDITRGLEIWAYVEFLQIDLNQTQTDNDEFPYWLEFIGGYGVGKFENSNQPCISQFTRNLLVQNLYPLLPDGHKIRIEVVFPQGKKLGLRTSNKAFGVVDGLALIGTQAEVQISASPDQLQNAINGLRVICSDSSFDGFLTFVIGQNGLDLAERFGLPARSIVKTGNWLGPLVIAAAEEGVKNLLLFGYHGKLIKLAGGIFHTHHHLADGRIEVLTSLAINEQIPLYLVKKINQASSVEDALSLLEHNDSKSVFRLWSRVAMEIENRTQQYITRYMTSSMSVGAILFDRSRKIRWTGPAGNQHLSSLGLKLKT